MTEKKDQEQQENTANEAPKQLHSALTRRNLKAPAPSLAETYAATQSDPKRTR